MLKQKLSLLRKLGIYQLAGGLLGLLFIVWSIKVVFEGNVLLLLIYIAMALLFSYSVLCGVMCLRNHVKALVFSMTNQLLQVLGFAYAGFGFSFIAGVYFTFNFDINDFPGLSFGLGISKCIINYNTGNEQAVISINIVAIWVFYEILTMINSIKELEKDQQINSLGEN